VRLSPNEERNGVNDSTPEPLFEAASAALFDLGIAFLEVREPDLAAPTAARKGRRLHRSCAPLSRVSSS